jgi:hypothetical protein
MKRPALLFSGTLLLSAIPILLIFPSPPAGAAAAQVQSSPVVTVYKSRYCGCCKEWIEYLERNGFEVVTRDSEDMDGIKKQFQVSAVVASCHTAVVDGYVVEGHVPAEAIQRLLKERPSVVGVSAPGMPADSPGMGRGSDEPRRYDVVTFTKEGKTGLFARY